MNFPHQIVVLIPAHNEEVSIAATIEAILDQERAPDRIVVIANGCADRTAEIARSFPVTVLELPRLEHKKSEALNRAWLEFAQDADIVVCLDADTVLPANAVGNWEGEFIADEQARADVSRRHDGPPRGGQTSKRPSVRGLALGGSSSKFTMRGRDFLTRLQRAEFSRWTDTALRRGWTTVLAGTGAAISGEALRQVAARDDREGPWCYASQVEDFELTYRIRELGYRCQVSPMVRAYTDSMKTVKALWGQRMKWQVGTIEDLLRIGVNRLTILDWFQQASGIFSAVARYLWAAIGITLCLVGHLQFQWLWMVALPLFFVAVQVKHALRIPHRDKTDVLYAFLIYPSEAFAWLRAGWFTAAWVQAPLAMLLGRRKDRWTLQYSAEAFRRGLIGKVRMVALRMAALSLAGGLALLSIGNLAPASGLPTVEAIAQAGPVTFRAEISEQWRRYEPQATSFFTGQHTFEPDAMRAGNATFQIIGTQPLGEPHRSTRR